MSRVTFFGIWAFSIARLKASRFAFRLAPYALIQAFREFSAWIIVLRFEVVSLCSALHAPCFLHPKIFPHHLSVLFQLIHAAFIHDRSFVDHVGAVADVQRKERILLSHEKGVRLTIRVQEREFRSQNSGERAQVLLVPKKLDLTVT